MNCKGQQELAGDVNAGKSLLTTESPEAVASAGLVDRRPLRHVHPLGVVSPRPAAAGRVRTANRRRIMYYLKIPLAQYTTLARQFNPVQFNADQWAGLAKEAGMKYMVITAKHHEGFAMYDSKLQRLQHHRPLSLQARPAGGAERSLRQGWWIKFWIYYSLGSMGRPGDASG